MITIVIPTYNRLKYLVDAYLSVINQDNNKYILYIVDDSTNNETYEYFSKINLHKNVFYIRNKKNLGIVKNFSKSFYLAKTKWVTLLSDDDILDSNFVSKSLEVLNGSNNAIVVASFRDIDINGSCLRNYLHKKISLSKVEAFVSFFYGNYPVAGISGFFLNTELCKELFKIKEYPNAILSDSYLCFSASALGGMETIDRVIYSRRRWPGSLSSGGVGTVSKAMNLYITYRAQKEFQKDLYDLWVLLINQNVDNGILKNMKIDIEDYCKQNAINNGIIFQIKKRYNLFSKKIKDKRW